jgi:undecaprenyl-diphosphatase
MPAAGGGLGRLRALDLAGLRFARTFGHGPRRERAVRRFSSLGEHAAVWLAGGLTAAAIDHQRRDRWTRATATVGGAYLGNTLVKLLVRRRRPDLPGLPALAGTPTGLSFPSAHSTSSFAAARLYAPLIGSAAPVYALAGALAYSRLYLGVHYPSDVLAGACLGHAIGSAAR